ncbi:MAG: BMP family ABC transporter substrate-binding protein [Bacillota bacterium]|nr:BMP family ABC transporter substrate-binding protein [Bacillota bacterium]
MKSTHNKHLICPVYCLFLFFLLLFSGCAEKPAPEEIPAEEKIPKESWELVLITGPLGLEDSMTQEAWLGLQDHAAESGASCRTWQPKSNDYLSIMEEAINAGAHLLISPSSLQEEALLQLQSRYPDVFFLTVDYLPGGTDKNADFVPENCHALLFAEEEAGFLAGYAAVMDDYVKLGFAGESRQEGYGLGFLQGVDAAANMLGRDVELYYGYTDKLPPGASILSMIYPWYIDETEIIFGCGKHMLKPLIKAAEASCSAIIAADTDQQALSDTVLLSAVKDIRGAVHSALQRYSSQNLPGGSISLGNLKNGGVSLAMESCRLKNFRQQDYEKLLETLSRGEYSIHRADEDGVSPESLCSERIRLRSPD